jgi:hypothetical protein
LGEIELNQLRAQVGQLTAKIRENEAAVRQAKANMLEAEQLRDDAFDYENQVNAEKMRFVNQRNLIAAQQKKLDQSEKEVHRRE